MVVETCRAKALMSSFNRAWMVAENFVKPGRGESLKAIQ